MTQSELSDKFDVLLASYEGGIELDEYEKSVFFNKAHVDLIREYYIGLTPSGRSYDSSEESKSYFSRYLYSITYDIPENEFISISRASNCLFIISEYVKDENIHIPVVPVSHDDYIKVLNNPFKNHRTRRRALRIDMGENDPDNPSYQVISSIPGVYTCWYIGFDPEIDFVHSGNQDVMIHPTFLEIILQRAVELAVQSRGTIKKSNV